MKSSVELYSLIACLTKKEKAYYKMHSSKRLKNHKTYHTIFDTTSKMLKQGKAFEAIEDMLKEKYEKQLPIYKLRLQQHLLNSLVECTFNENDPIRSIHNTIAYGRIFLIKYQYKSALKYFRKAFELSKKADRYEYQISIAKSILFTISKFSKDDAKYQQLYDEILQALSEMIDAHNIQLKLIKWVFEISKNMEENDIIRDAEILEKLKYEVEHGILQNCTVRNARTIEIFNELLAWYYNSTKNYKAHRMHHIETIKEKNQVSKFENNDFQRLHKPYSNILSSSIYLKDKQSSKQYLKKIKQLDTKSELAEKNKADIITFFTIRMNDVWETKEKTLNQIKNIALQFDGSNPRELIYEIQLVKTVVQLLFKHKKYDDVIYWLNRLKTVIDSPDFQSLFRGVCVFEMIVQYEIGNYDLLSYLLRNAKRRSKNKQLNFKLEQVMFSLFQDLIKLPNQKEKSIRFAKTKKQLNQLDALDFIFASEDFVTAKAWVTENL